MNQQIFWLDISVNDLLAMAVFNGFEQLVDVVAHLVELNAIWVLFKDFEEILFEVFEHKIKTVASKGEKS